MSDKVGSLTVRSSGSRSHSLSSTRAKRRCLDFRQNGIGPRRGLRCSHDRFGPLLTEPFNRSRSGSGRGPSIAANSPSPAPSWVRIATVAYQEGEIGILQLLDAYRVQRQAQLRLVEIQAAVKEAQIEVERVVGEEFGK